MYRCVLVRNKVVPPDSQEDGMVSDSPIYYIKAAAVCLLRDYGGEFDRHLPLPFPISLTRSGIPRAFDIPMNVGLRWLPVWSSTPVKDTSRGCPGDTSLLFTG